MKKPLLVIGCLGLLACAVIGPCLFGFLSAFIEDSKNYPGKAQFEIEDNKISVFGGGATFGNTPEALKIAHDFSEALQGESKVFFTGGSTFTPATMGHFLTNCQIPPKGVVVLCQVPDLRGYHDDVRDVLAKLAWLDAQEAARSAKLADKMSLVVGLRGFGSYGTIWGEP